MLTDGLVHASERQALHDGNQILMKAWRVSGTSERDRSRQDEAGTARRLRCHERVQAASRRWCSRKNRNISPLAFGPRGSV